MPLPIMRSYRLYELGGFAVTGPSEEETEAALRTADRISKTALRTIEEYTPRLPETQLRALKSKYEATLLSLRTGWKLFHQESTAFFVSNFDEAKKLADSAAREFTRLVTAADEFTTRATVADLERQAAISKGLIERVPEEERLAAEKGIAPYFAYKAKEAAGEVAIAIPWWVWAAGAVVGLAVLAPYARLIPGRR